LNWSDLIQRNSENFGGGTPMNIVTAKKRFNHL